MRVLYVARHHAGGNEDEVNIHDALTSLGHSVVRVEETHPRCRDEVLATARECDLLLFHAWGDDTTLAALAGKIPRVFWYFDLVDFPDPVLARRCADRRARLERITPHIDLGFMTDGDWVARDTSGKLIWLMQGAPTRLASQRPRWERGAENPGPDLLFTGIANGGTVRQSFVNEMSERYGARRFQNIRRNCHGRSLADRIVRARIVLAPDAPVTDRYHSNRLYLTLGFGGFLLHPYSEAAIAHYAHGEGVVYYRDRDELHNLIGLYLGDLAPARRNIAEAGWRKTVAQHCYLHRCRELIATVRQRLGVTT